MKKIIGRKIEIAILKKALSSTNAELVCVTGRLKVGKTFLINPIYKKQIVFSISGTPNTPLKEQLGNFAFLDLLPGENLRFILPHQTSLLSTVFNK